MTAKQIAGSHAPDGSTYVTITDGAGTLGEGATVLGAVTQSGTWTVQPGNTANTTAWKVDGSAVTQPVSGTVTTTPPSNASSNVAQINAVTPLMGNGATGTGALRVSIANDSTGIVALPAAGTSVVGTKAAGTAAATSVLTGGVYTSIPPVTTNAQQVALQVSPVGSLFVESEGRRDTYGAQATITLASSATDVFTIYPNSSKTIRIRKLRLSGLATAATAAHVLLIKRSSAASGGSSTNPTVVPYSTGNASSQATITAYTGNPTPGSAVGTLGGAVVVFTPAASATAANPVQWDFSTRNSQPISFFSTSTGLAVNLNGVTVTGGVLNVEIEWTEE